MKAHGTLLIAGLVFSATGCTLAEPYLLPRQSVELMSSLQPNMRPRAEVPALHESDRAPVLIDYRAIQLSDEELAKVHSRPAKFYRVRAAGINPMTIVGGVFLGMALPHLGLGLGVFLDTPSPSGERAFTDTAGGALALTLTGLHLIAGGVLLSLGARKPHINPVPARFVEQYTNPAAAQPEAPDVASDVETNP